MESFYSIRELISTIEAYHDSYTKMHEDKVGKLMRILGKAAGCEEPLCVSLEESGSLHDIGKLAIPAKILDKPGALTAFEREVVELHVEIGCKLVNKIQDPNRELTLNIVATHHESFDGSGYPNHLKGKQIPLEGRICSICDIYDALRSYRPYRDKLTHENIIQMMQYKGPNGFANKFDPDLLEIFTKIGDQYVHLYNLPSASTVNTIIDPSHR